MVTKTNIAPLDILDKCVKDISVLLKALENDLDNGELYKGDTFILFSLIEAMGKYDWGYKTSISGKIYELAKEHYKGNDGVIKKASEYEKRFTSIYFNYLNFNSLEKDIDSGLESVEDFLYNDIMSKRIEMAVKIVKLINEYNTYVLEPLDDDLKTRRN